MSLGSGGGRSVSGVVVCSMSVPCLVSVPREGGGIAQAPNGVVMCRGWYSMLPWPQLYVAKTRIRGQVHEAAKV